MKLPKVYEPGQYEDDIYKLWEKSQAFKPVNRGGSKPYSMVMPPPNANANIHLGTAITLGLEDIAVRYNRLKGNETLFVPGSDHAGIETQFVYEKQLAKQGKSRLDFSREDLYQQIWGFVEQNKAGYEVQFRKLGISTDWDRYVYTLDKKVVDQAYKTFEKMWNEGLIYRGERLVNFCTFHGTGFADIEVVYKNQKGKLWQIKYPLTDGSGEVVVATTRPETMLGDTAVAVHPTDKRYKQYIGKTVRLPLTNREIPIISDEMVDTKFGTGAVKITPAHDMNDFEVGERHDLPRISVIDYEGKITSDAPEPYRGLSVNDAREGVIKDLEEQGYLVEVQSHKHAVGHCYKCDSVIQPLLKEQWFVDMQTLAKPAIKVLENNDITFYPDAKRLQLIRYLEGIKDWNISRQVAWGIPIPAFYNVDKPDDWIFESGVDQEEIIKNSKTYRRDPDVFDTWFSSSSWPYVTLGFPDADDYKKFYPLSLMETGGEILYPWVSRMIMLGLYVTGQVPFKAVYIHGYVMAEDGTKMSKSVGNVIDPLPVIDKYGSDALRMGIISGRVPAVNRGYDSRKIEDARNFANKVWNIARYVEDKLGDRFKLGEADPTSPQDHWILTKLQHLTEVVSTDLDNYRFAEAYDSIYHFVWDDFADWYIEASKSAFNPSVLAKVLEATLVILHPYAPFLTETIWQTLKREEDNILASSTWPNIDKANRREAQKFSELKTLIEEIRFLAGELKLKDLELYITDKDFVSNNGQLIKQLARVKKITSQPVNGLKLTAPGVDAILKISKEDLENYKDSLAKRITEQEKVIKQLEGRLKNKAYVANAPAELVKESEQQLKDAEKMMKNMLEEQRKRF